MQDLEENNNWTILDPLENMSYILIWVWQPFWVLTTFEKYKLNYV